LPHTSVRYQFPSDPRIRIDVLDVTEQSTPDEVVGSMRTLVGGSKTIAYSELEMAGSGVEDPPGVASDACCPPAAATGWTAGELFEPAEGAGPEAGPDAAGEADEELLAGLFAGLCALEGAAGLFSSKAPTMNASPSNPDKSLTGVLETGESTSASKILKLPPVMAISSRTPPSTSKPIMMLCGMARPFQSICPAETA
jgi:hypothetical protein